MRQRESGRRHGTPPKEVKVVKQQAADREVKGGRITNLFQR